MAGFGCQKPVPHPPTQPKPAEKLPPASFQELQKKTFPASDLVREREATSRAGYRAWIATYQSEGLTIRGLLTVPKGTPAPSGGWSLLVFVHGYGPPSYYSTERRYFFYQDFFACRGFITFKPDFRGHGISQGQTENPYLETGYLTDVLVAAKSLQHLKEGNPQKLVLWGHSMGGLLALKAAALDPEVRAAVVASGVVGSWKDLENWGFEGAWKNVSPSAVQPFPSLPGWENLVEKFGSPSLGSKDSFWTSTDLVQSVGLTRSALLFQHGLADGVVPWQLSLAMASHFWQAGKAAELKLYPENDHDLNQDLEKALNDGLSFFRRNLAD